MSPKIPPDISGPLPASLCEYEVKYFYVKGSQSEDPSRMPSGTSIGYEGILNIIVHFCDLLRFHAR